jgi:hypothetical protein
MLWWFLILGASVVVIAAVASLLYVQVRNQMKRPSAGAKPHVDDVDQNPPAH